jgi:hypothetical protein
MKALFLVAIDCPIADFSAIIELCEKTKNKDTSN